MNKILSFMLICGAVVLFGTSCSESEPEVLKPKIDETTIVCNLTTKTISFKAECPTGTKIQVLLRQLTNGTEEKRMETLYRATAQEFYVNLTKLVGGSTYAYYIIGIDSNGAECYRTPERTFTVDKYASPAAPSVYGIKAYAPSSLVAADGYIEGDILTEEIEYSTDDEQTWKAVTVKGTISGLRSGKVFLRIAETPTTEAGKSSFVQVPPYKSNTDLDGDGGKSEGLTSAG